MKPMIKIIMVALLFCINYFSGFSQKVDADPALDQLEHANELIKNGKEIEFLTMSVEIVKQSADLENTQAAYMTGVFYLVGVGVPADKNIGERYLEIAAKKGSPEAQALLVREYQSGYHLKKNKEKSEMWEKMLLNNQNLYLLSARPTNQLISLNEVLAKAIRDSYGSNN